MKRFYFVFTLAFVLSAIFSFTPVSFASAKLKTDISFNQPVYEATDKITINVNLKPLTDISDVRVNLKIGTEDNYVFSRTLFLGNIAKDKKQSLTFEKNNASNFGLKPGANPILIEVTSLKKPIYTFESNLGIKEAGDDHSKVLQVGFALNIADKPHLDMDKNLTDNLAQKSTIPKISQYEKLFAKHKGFFGVIFNPLLAETIIKIGDGPSKQVLARYKNAFQANTAFLIISAYSQLDLKKASTDILNDQFLLGRKTLDEIFEPSNTNEKYSLTSEGLSIRQDNKVKYLPISKPMQNAKSHQESTMNMLAFLTESFNKQRDNIVLISDNLPNSSHIADFVAIAKKQKWLKLVPLRSLKTSTTKYKESNKKPTKSSIYKARQKYFLFKESLASQNQAFEQAKMAIYLAEDKNTPKAESQILAQKANGLLEGELDKITLQLTPLTLTGKNGKLPIKIINNTNSKFNFSIELKTTEFALKNKSETLTVNPRENLISIPVKVLKSGHHKVLVQLKSNNTLVTKDYLTVSTSLPGQFWYYIGAVLAVLLLLVIGAFYVREKRSSKSSKH